MKRIILAASLLLAACQTTKPTITEQWPAPSYHEYWEYDSIQGLYSNPLCPHQYPAYGEDPGNGQKFFLGCWGHRE